MLYYDAQLDEMEADSESNKKQSVKIQMLAEQEVVLLRQQILALRRALSDSEKEAGEMRKKLDKEVSWTVALWFSHLSGKVVSF